MMGISLRGVQRDLLDIGSILKQQSVDIFGRAANATEYIVSPDGSCGHQESHEKVVAEIAIASGAPSTQITDVIVM